MFRVGASVASLPLSITYFLWIVSAVAFAMMVVRRCIATPKLKTCLVMTGHGKRRQIKIDFG